MEGQAFNPSTYEVGSSSGASLLAMDTHQMGPPQTGSTGAGEQVAGLPDEGGVMAVPPSSFREIGMVLEVENASESGPIVTEPPKTVPTAEMMALSILEMDPSEVRSSEADTKATGSPLALVPFNSFGTEGELDSVGTTDTVSLECEDVCCWEDPFPLVSLHPFKNNNSQASNWVLNMAKEMQFSMGILCDGFEDQLIALFAAIEAGKNSLGSPREFTSVKKQARELYRLDWTVNDGASRKSSNRGRVRGRVKDVVL